MPEKKGALRQCAELAVQQNDPTFGVEAPQEGGIRSDPAQLMSTTDLPSLDQGAGKDSGQAKSGQTALGSVDENTDGENENSLPLSLPPRECGEQEKGPGRAEGAATTALGGGGVSGGETAAGKGSASGVATGGKEDSSASQQETKQVKEGGGEADNGAQTGNQPPVVRSSQGGGKDQGGKKMEPTITDEVSRRLYAFITAEVKSRLQEAVWEAHRRHDEESGKRKTAELVGEEAC